MAEYRKGDLFVELPEKYVLVHGANAQGVMGSGFAAKFKQEFPNSYFNYKHSDHKLGGIITEKINDCIIISAITQEFYGKEYKRYVSYDAVEESLSKVSKLANDLPVYMPFIGGGLGGGDRNILMAIFEYVFKNTIAYVYSLD